MYKDWKNRCKEFFNHFYTSDGTVTEVITVPDITGKQKDSSRLNLPINTLQKWCNFSQNSLGLIVRMYNIIEHLKFLGATETKLREIVSTEEFPKDKKQLIVFNACEKVIFIIHFVSDSDNLNEEINHCVGSVKLFSLLLKEELSGSGVVIAGLIVSDVKTKHVSGRCDDCKYLIIPREIFDSPEKFLRFWDEYKTGNHFNELKTEIAESNKDHVFHDVCSKILGYMARHKTSVLPTLKNNPIQNIEEAEMLLNRYQMEIVYSRENHVILKGAYGSGKTIIALKKIQLLLESIKDKEVIYYVNFTCKSEVHYFIKHKMKMFKDLDQKLFIIPGGYDLSCIVKSVILPTEEEKGTKKIHLFVDEYFSENLTIKEANALSGIFTETKQFRNSNVLIAVQPIEINRTDYYYVGKSVTKNLTESHAFDILATDMKVYTLKYVMRTTVQINELVQVTEKFLNDQSNEYTRQLESEKKLASTLKPVSEFFRRINKKIKLTRKEDNIVKDNQDSASKVTSRSSPNSQQSSSQVTASSNIADIDSQKTIDHDELHKLTFSASSRNKKKNVKIVTTYRYSCNSKIGHGIRGPLPNVIQLPTTADKYEQIALIGILFKTIENIESKRVAVIHFESNNPDWLMSLLELKTIFPSASVTDDLETFLQKHDDNLILVKNYNSVKGLEFPHVFMILDANEYHLKQYIPETMARSQNSLSILIKSLDSKNYIKDTVADLIKYWEKVNAEEENPILSLSYLKFCSKTRCSKNSDITMSYCLENSGSVSTYNFHKNCKLYKDLHEEISTVATSKADEEAKRAAVLL